MIGLTNILEIEQELVEDKIRTALDFIKDEDNIEERKRFVAYMSNDLYPILSSFVLDNKGDFAKYQNILNKVFDSDIVVSCDSIDVDYIDKIADENWNAFVWFIEFTCKSLIKFMEHFVGQ